MSEGRRVRGVSWGVVSCRRRGCRLQGRREHGQRLGGSWAPTELLVLATSPTASDSQLADEGYRRVRAVGGVAIYMDGLRLTWRMRSARIWIKAGPTEES